MDQDLLSASVLNESQDLNGDLGLVGQDVDEEAVQGEKARSTPHHQSSLKLFEDLS